MVLDPCKGVPLLLEDAKEVGVVVVVVTLVLLWYPRMDQYSEVSCLMGIAKLRVELEGCCCCDAKVPDEAEDGSRSSERLASWLLLSDTESVELLFLLDKPPIGRVLFAMLFTS